MLATFAFLGLLDVAVSTLLGSVKENGTVTDSNETVLDKAKAMNHSTDDLEETKCSFQSFPLAHTIQATATAAGSSIYPTYATNEEMDFGIDMAGLWWMMGNVLAEEFVSWKGATADTPNSFPLTMTSPTNLMGSWVWPESFKGRALMSYYALTEEPTVPQVATWTNSTYAVIVPIAGGSTEDAGFQYVLRKNYSDESGDVWIRENLDSPEDTEPEYIYTLVRVVNGDGTANAKWWPEFEKYAEELGITDLQIWGNDNACMRACQAFHMCSFCKWWCGPDEKKDVALAWQKRLNTAARGRQPETLQAMKDHVDQLLGKQPGLHTGDGGADFQMGTATTATVHKHSSQFLGRDASLSADGEANAMLQTPPTSHGFDHSESQSESSLSERFDEERHFKNSEL